MFFGFIRRRRNLLHQLNPDVSDQPVAILSDPAMPASVTQPLRHPQPAPLDEILFVFDGLRQVGAAVVAKPGQLRHLVATRVPYLIIHTVSRIDELHTGPPLSDGSPAR